MFYGKSLFWVLYIRWTLDEGTGWCTVECRKLFSIGTTLFIFTDEKKEKPIVSPAHFTPGGSFGTPGKLRYDVAAAWHTTLVGSEKPRTKFHSGTNLLICVCACVGTCLSPWYLFDVVIGQISGGMFSKDFLRHITICSQYNNTITYYWAWF